MTEILHSYPFEGVRLREFLHPSVEFGVRLLSPKLEISAQNLLK
jgi:hypothetical protein